MSTGKNSRPPAPAVGTPLLGAPLPGSEAAWPGSDVPLRLASAGVGLVIAGASGGGGVGGQDDLGQWCGAASGDLNAVQARSGQCDAGRNRAVAPARSGCGNLPVGCGVMDGDPDAGVGVEGVAGCGQNLQGPGCAGGGGVGQVEAESTG